MEETECDRQHPAANSLEQLAQPLALRVRSLARVQARKEETVNRAPRRLWLAQLRRLWHWLRLRLWRRIKHLRKGGADQDTRA